MEEKGQHWLGRLRQINWARNKRIRRLLKPLFSLIDRTRLGDVVVAILQKDDGFGA